MKRQPKPVVVAHYGDDIYEPIKIIEHYGLGFNLANALKYILRSGRKDILGTDLQKAENYIHRERLGEWMNDDV